MNIAVSSWALHREIGIAYWNSPENDVFEESVHSSYGKTVEALAGEIKRHGYHRLELCHFHLKSRDRSYLSEVSRSLKDSGLVLQTLLIDDGNLTDARNGERDLNWVRKWIHAGLDLGAEGARVIAGKDDWGPENFETSAQYLLELAGIGLGIRIENWFDLLKTPEHVNRLLDRLEGRVGLCVDFGNWAQPAKHADLAAIAGRAETAHAKAEFLNPKCIDATDYGRCLSACIEAGYSGPYILVIGGSLPTEWDALDIQRSFIEDYLTPSRASV